MKKVISIFFILISLRAHVQTMDDIFKMIPSPNAAGLLKDYQISNDHYNGTVNVSIPIYTFEAKGMKLPIGLSYSGGGIKADQLPTWVGLGWNLNAGGQIIRITKNQPDEFEAFITQIDVVPGQHVIRSTGVAPTDYSYLTNCNTKLNRSDWSDASYLNTLNANLPYSSTVGSTTFTNANPLYDLEPDEFSFNVNGVSGRFYLNYTGNWIAVSDVPGISFTVQPTIKTNIDVPGGKSIPRAIVQFIIKASDGTTYYFGEDLDDNPKNIEYNYTGFLDRPGSDPYTRAQTDIMPSAWHLRKIVTPIGQEVTFQYKKMGYQSAKTRVGAVGGSYSMHKTLTESWYLEKIIAGSEEVTFESFVSNQLGSDETIESDNIEFYNNDAPLPSSIIGDLNTYPKLSFIKVYSNSNLVKTFSFSYIENLTERLKLEYFREINVGSTSLIEYKFEYNTAKLPVYGAALADHWGFYNGTNFFQTTPGPYTYSVLTTLYSPSRDPNFTLGKSEILQKIVFPTKGTVEFIYQALEYSKVANVWPFNLSDAGVDKEAGGARIYQILKRNDVGVITEQVEYNYDRSGSALSSGILASPIPDYVVGDASNFTFRAEGFSALNDRGGLVVYPRVVEKYANNSYKVFEYESYDNGYNDIGPLIELPSGSHSYNFNKNSFNNRRFVRGKLKKESFYNSINSLVKEVEYTYIHNNAPSGKLRNIRYMPAVRWTDHVYRSAAYETDIYPDLQSTVKAKEYSASGNIEMIQEYTYDQDNNVIQSKLTNSKGEIITTAYKYSNSSYYNNIGTDDKSLGIQNLKAKSIKNLPIETFVTKAINANPPSSERVISGSLVSYLAGQPLVKELYNLEIKDPIPLANFTQSTISNGNFLQDNHYKKQATFLNYDNYGNVLTASKELDIKYTYLWGYNGKYPVAKVVGSEYNTVLALINQAVLDNPASDAVLRSELDKIRTGLASSKVLVSTYTYAPLVGLTSETDPRGRTIYYKYDKLNRLSLVVDQDKNILKKICYNYAGQPEECSTLIYNSAEVSQIITPNNCAPGLATHPLFIFVPQGQFISVFDQADANAQAMAHAQQLANQQGFCFVPFYARIEYEPLWVDQYQDYYNEIVDVWVRFYSDAACTQPYILPANLSFSTYIAGSMWTSSGYTQSMDLSVSRTALSGTNELFLETELPLFGYQDFYDGEELVDFEKWTARCVLQLPNNKPFLAAPQSVGWIALPPWY